MPANAQNFTPGPWHVEADGTIRSTRDNIRHSDQMADYRGAIVCDVSKGLGDDMTAPIARGHALPETEANARLIVAAPDLYAVAEMLIEANRTATDQLNFTSKIALACEYARAALAKAEGRP